MRVKPQLLSSVISVIPSVQLMRSIGGSRETIRESKPGTLFGFNIIPGLKTKQTPWQTPFITSRTDTIIIPEIVHTRQKLTQIQITRQTYRMPPPPEITIFHNYRAPPPPTLVRTFPFIGDLGGAGGGGIRRGKSFSNFLEIGRTWSPRSMARGMRLVGGIGSINTLGTKPPSKGKKPKRRSGRARRSGK